MQFGPGSGNFGATEKFLTLSYNVSWREVSRTFSIRLTVTTWTFGADTDFSHCGMKDSKAKTKNATGTKATNVLIKARSEKNVTMDISSAVLSPP